MKKDPSNSELLKTTGRWLMSAVALIAMSSVAQEQTPSVIFEDDFESNQIDAARYEQADPFFEGGKGDIHAEAGDGEMRFVGQTTQQWWSGGTLRIKESFVATEEIPVTLTIDRVEEAGRGSASRSALWIFDENEKYYILFADVRGEGGWGYNRYIGQAGDVKTGNGTNIRVYDGGAFDNGDIHEMHMVANGSTVKLFLDGDEGPEIPFPFSPVIFHFGSYARADNDTADTTWDNLVIEGYRKKVNVLFSDDFESGQIDETLYREASLSFEGGDGDIHAEAGDGVMRFTGTTTLQPWSSGSLRILPAFAPSPSQKLTLSVDRVAEAGQGNASRSALWILDETETHFVLFADVRGDGGWKYNRKIGRPSDNPTGSGTDIEAFNGTGFDDGGKHRMSMVADGMTVKLLLDGIEGADVSFPFSPVVFHFGSAARDNNDTANTSWDNLMIENEGDATFSTTGVGVLVGSESTSITVRIPQGLNSQKSIGLTIVSADPTIAEPLGGSDGRLDLTFSVGGSNTLEFRVAGKKLGRAQLSIESDDVTMGASFQVAVVAGSAVLMEDDFQGTSIDSTRWTVNERGLEGGVGTHQLEATGGRLKVEGFTDTTSWAGASLKTADSYQAIEDLHLVFEIDRSSIKTGGNARSGVFISNDDRSRYVFFSQLSEAEGSTSWRVNVNPGTPTGSGTVIDAFATETEWEDYRLKMVADGRWVEVFLNGVSGGRFPFEVTSEIHCEVGAYGQNVDDQITATFDNAIVRHTLPCIEIDASDVLLTLDETQELTVSVPRFLNDLDLQVTVVSSDPGVAIPTGADDASRLTLDFVAGGPSSLAFRISPIGVGSANFSVTSDLFTIPETPQCYGSPVRVEIVSPPTILLSDDFSGSEYDAELWQEDRTSFNDTGTAKDFPDSSVTIENGVLLIHMEVKTPLWPGLALFTKETFPASTADPLTFEMDRKSVDYVLAAGASSESRTGIWVRSGDNYIFFVDHTTHDARDFGWRYNRNPGANANEESGDGINISAFDGVLFDNQGNHRMKMVLNGSTAKLYLDDVLGVELDFPHSKNLTFGVGAYADVVGPVDPDTGAIRGNQTTGYFDNALISGSRSAGKTITSYSLNEGNLVVEWRGSALKESDTVDGDYQPIAGATPPTTSIPVGNGNKFIIALP